MCARDPPLRVDEATQVCALRLAKGSLSGDTCAFTKVYSTHNRASKNFKAHRSTSSRVFPESLNPEKVVSTLIQEKERACYI
jgi:hypothetical protein